jgi:hypothetical protein
MLRVATGSATRIDVVLREADAGQELFDEVFAPIVNKVVRPFELNFTADEFETLADHWSRL